MGIIDNKFKRLEILNKYNGRCAYCGKKLTIETLSIDHIEPRFRKTTDEQLKWYNRERGENKMENYNPCCKSCNSSKSTFTIEKFREEISKKQQRLLRDNSTYRLLLRFGLVKQMPNNVVFYFERF
jgi:5-methylcytosine-specific restriction endonuclease McrA